MDVWLEAERKILQKLFWRELLSLSQSEISQLHSSHIWLVVWFPLMPQHIKTRSFILTLEAKHHPQSSDTLSFHSVWQSTAISSPSFRGGILDSLLLFTAAHTRLSKCQLSMSPPKGNTKINGQSCSPPRGDLQREQPLSPLPLESQPLTKQKTR